MRCSPLGIEVDAVPDRDDLDALIDELAGGDAGLFLRRSIKRPPVELRGPRRVVAGSQLLAALEALAW